MNYPIVNKKVVCKNKEMKKAQKYAKKLYGRCWGRAPKSKINKVVSLENISYQSLSDQFERSMDKTGMGQSDFQSKEEFLDWVEQSGLTGLSGDGFKTAEKLKGFFTTNAEKRYFVINAVNCDPGLVHDEWILSNKMADVMNGIELIKRFSSFDRIMIATKRKVTAEDSELFVKVPNRHPMGEERILIENLLGIKLSADEYPSDKGILVMNLQTVLALGTGDFSNRYLTVADLTVAKGQVVKVPIGIKIADVIKTTLPEYKDAPVYTGFGVFSAHLSEESETVNYSTNFIGYGNAPDYAEATACKGCGGCTSKCPMRIKVHKIVQAVERKDMNGIEAFGAKNCIGCASCTYICHAGKNVMEIVAGVN